LHYGNDIVYLYWEEEIRHFLSTVKDQKNPLANEQAQGTPKNDSCLSLGRFVEGRGSKVSK